MDDGTDYPNFADFADPQDGVFDGNKVDLKSILDKRILIIGYKVRPSKHQDENYLTLQFEMDGNRFVVFTGSTVLTDQITRYENKIPFYAKITRLGKYYTFI